MGTAAEVLTDVVRIGADVEPLGAIDGEGDFGEVDVVDGVVGDVNRAWLAFDHLSLSGKFVEWHTILFDRGDHGWDLLEGTCVFFKGVINVLIGEVGDGFSFLNITFLVLRGCGDAEGERAFVFLVFAHEEVLDFCGFADDKHEESCCHRVKGAAVTNFFKLELSAADGNGIMGGHVGFFIDEENAAGLGECWIVHG